MTSWSAQFFGDEFAQFSLQRSEKEQQHTIDFLERVTDVQPGCRVYDQCCGRGDLSLEFARRGYHLVGADQSASYIDHARKRTKSEKLDAQFVCEDASEYVVVPGVHLVFNWYTSFGYAPDDEENKKMLMAAKKSLVPGGAFVLDFYHLPYIFADFQPVTEQSFPQENIQLRRTTTYDSEHGLMRSEWRFTKGKKTKTFAGVSRAYLPVDLKHLCESVGFKDIQFFGDVDASPLTLVSKRCILLARS